MDGIIRRPSEASEVILLLHGLGERGRRLYRKLLPYLPEKAIVLAPNGPFPMPKNKEQRIAYGFSWYFYDRFEKKYLINQDLAKSWLKELLHLLGLTELPLTIIGFSQGGYLAPVVGKELARTKLVVGIGCEFRHNLIDGPLHFRLEALHGKEDEIVPFQGALEELEQLKSKHIESGWHLIEDTGHEITRQVGQKVREILEEHGKRSL